MPKRLLIAAGEAASGVDALPFGVRELIDAANEVLVVTPRLEAVLGQIEELGTEASGTVGADDPLLAFDDALATFNADHILVGLRAPDRADWQERGLLDELLRRFGIPVTVFSLRE